MNTNHFPHHLHFTPSASNNNLTNVTLRLKNTTFFSLLTCLKQYFPACDKSLPLPSHWLFSDPSFDAVGGAYETLIPPFLLCISHFFLMLPVVITMVLIVSFQPNRPSCYVMGRSFFVKG